jgi:hypothetical protein
MNITKKQCEEFKSNPKINPLTGRKIQIGKITYKNLSKACNEIPREIIVSSNHSYPLIKANSISSHRLHEVPPMGPMMHWNINTKTSVDKVNNLLDFCDYIEDRLVTIKKLNSASEMELNEFEDILKYAKKLFKDDKDTIKSLIKSLRIIESIRNSHKIIPDLPKETVVNNKYIKSNRLSIRENIEWIYRIYNSAMKSMNIALKDKEINFDVQKGEIQNIVKNKVYLDYVIKHKIFTYDDIYKHTFTSERVFVEILETFKEYSKLYKKLKGKNP